MGIANEMVGPSRTRESQSDPGARLSHSSETGPEPDDGFITVRGLLNSVAIGLGMWAVLLTVLWLVFA